MKKIALMFPGQGSQKVGMGQELYETYPKIKNLYENANKVLNKNIIELMFEGPEDELKETENAQPALLLSSIAVHQLLLDRGVKVDMAVGHSLGEYSALVAAGAIQLDDALPLVAERGRLMEQAFPSGKGSMSAVLGLSREEIDSALQKLDEDHIVDIANLNCPGQIVLSGSIDGLKNVEPILKEVGARRIIPLNVSGPFHSRLMKPANETFSEELDGIVIGDAQVPIYANVTAQPVTDKLVIKDLLIKQLYSPVRFEESIVNMIASGVDAFIEVGNGKILCGLVRKIDRNIPTFNIQDGETMEKFIHWYEEEV